MRIINLSLDPDSNQSEKEGLCTMKLSEEHLANNRKSARPPSVFQPSCLVGTHKSIA